MSILWLFGLVIFLSCQSGIGQKNEQRVDSSEIYEDTRHLITAKIAKECIKRSEPKLKCMKRFRKLLSEVQEKDLANVYYNFPNSLLNYKKFTEIDNSLPTSFPKLVSSESPELNNSLPNPLSFPKVVSSESPKLNLSGPQKQGEKIFTVIQEVPKIGIVKESVKAVNISSNITLHYICPFTGSCSRTNQVSYCSKALN